MLVSREDPRFVTTRRDWIVSVRACWRVKGLLGPRNFVNSGGEAPSFPEEAQGQGSIEEDQQRFLHKTKRTLS